MKKAVRLQVYRHEPTETIIDSFQAFEWDEFLLIRFVGDITQEDVDKLAQATVHVDKQIILLPGDKDLELFGVREEEED